MGLTQEQTPDSQQTQSNPTNPPKDPSTLPPEAIALATSLFNYARAGQTAELRQYITAGIPVNLTNDKGDTLLMLASYHGHVPTVRMLIEKGADVNSLNERGQSIVAGAVFKLHDEVVKCLVEAGANPGLGQPSGVETARMFRREEVLSMFGEQEASSGAPSAPTNGVE